MSAAIVFTCDAECGTTAEGRFAGPGGPGDSGHLIRPIGWSGGWLYVDDDGNEVDGYRAKSHPIHIGESGDDFCPACRSRRVAAAWVAYREEKRTKAAAEAERWK